MNGAHAPVAHSEIADAYVTRIEAHLARLAAGHDPLGHLFAIERLARAARAEGWAAEHDAQGTRHGR
jgi:hypothetical protein